MWSSRGRNNAGVKQQIVCLSGVGAGQRGAGRQHQQSSDGRGDDAPPSPDEVGAVLTTSG